MADTTGDTKSNISANTITDATSVTVDNTSTNTTDDTKVYHGWFSNEQVNRMEFFDPEKNSIFMYRSKSSSRLVPVSQVTIKKEHGTSFEDMVYTGEVTKFVSSMRKPKTMKPFSRLLRKLISDKTLDTVVDN